ncbi:MAG TPA: hypothetical protein VHF25_10085, partial [Nitriliruptorales bacterium]|nr:hypothetical protein [Nitriliruptorales bacterium]
PAVDPDCPARDHIAPDAAVRFLDRERTERDREAPLPRGYAFLAAADGCNPVRFDPCQPVHYVIGGDVSVETVNDAHEAVARTAEASGLRFVYDGTTEEDVRGRSPYQPERYGERWVPLLITFERRGTEPPRRPQDARRGDVAVVAGTGLPTALEDVIVTAQVSVNLNAIVDLDTGQTLPGGFGSGITRGRVLLHELGHAVGLGHVADRDHLMHEPLTDHPPGPARYAAGDRIGFRYVGRELGCLATPPLPDEPLPPPSGHPSGSVISPR